MMRQPLLAGALIVASTPAFAQLNEYKNLMMGDWWDDDTGAVITIDQFGNVMAQGSTVFNGVVRAQNGVGGSNFVFSNDKVTCYYKVGWLGRDGSQMAFIRAVDPEPVSGATNVPTCPQKVNFHIKFNAKSAQSQKADLEAQQAKEKADRDKSDKNKKDEADRLVQEARVARIASEAAARDLAGTKVVYFPKEADGDRVTNALKNIPIESGLPQLSNATNSIACGAGVPLTAVKRVLTDLIKGGVKVKDVYMVRAPDEKRGRIEVLAHSSAEDYPDMTLADVNALSTCQRYDTDDVIVDPPLVATPVEEVPFNDQLLVKNQCARIGKTHFRILYKSGSQWLSTTEANVEPNTERVITNKSGKAQITSRDWFVYGWSADNKWVYEGDVEITSLGQQLRAHRFSQPGIVTVSCKDFIPADG